MGAEVVSMPDGWIYINWPEGAMPSKEEIKEAAMMVDKLRKETLA